MLSHLCCEFEKLKIDGVVQNFVDVELFIEVKVKSIWIIYKTDEWLHVAKIIGTIRVIVNSIDGARISFVQNM